MKILMHVCCLPCFYHPFNILKSMRIEPIVYFFNPNIHPLREYITRRNLVKRFCDIENIEFIEGDYNIEKYFKFVLKEDKRCKNCFYYRLEDTFRKAGKLNISMVGTTLLTSIHQAAKEIMNIGYFLESKYNIKFLDIDFRLGYYESKLWVKSNNIYYQKYCGCVFSEKERFSFLFNDFTVF